MVDHQCYLKTVGLFLLRWPRNALSFTKRARLEQMLINAARSLGNGQAHGRSVASDQRAINRRAALQRHFDRDLAIARFRFYSYRAISPTEQAERQLTRDRQSRGCLWDAPGPSTGRRSAAFPA